MKKASAPGAVAHSASARMRPLEWFGVFVLAGLVILFLAVSWRKWPDPVIDFGRELYLPWRLADGAVLYRDVDDFYGPLSQYFNAGLFKLFGPGLMVLVGANLAIFAAIFALIYWLFRRAWGPLAAFVAAAIFVSVFGFSQSVGIGNYNYATPYAHEATHGLLVCLMLVAALPPWIEQASPWRSFLVGGLFGLSAVLKPEIILAAGLVTFAGVTVQRRLRRPLGRHAIGAWAAGAVLPTAAFAIYFSTQVSWKLAWEYAGRAWLNVAASNRFTGDPVQTGFLGFDQPGPHALEHGLATLLALGLIAIIGIVVWLSDRSKHWGFRWLLLSGSAMGMGLLSWFVLPWDRAGRCLFGLVLVYLVMCTVALPRSDRGEMNSARRMLRLLLAVVAVALLSRMVFNGRLVQFGFYQAALAALLVPAVLIGELPERLGSGRWGRFVAVVGAVAFFSPGVVFFAAHSRQLLQWKTQAVGEGRDQFFGFSPQMDPTGDLVSRAVRWLREATGGQRQTLLVLPEGEMINYLSRLPSPVAPFFFFSAATSGGREAAIVRELEKNPPDWVVIVSRDLREYGVQRYGESPEQGGQILGWIGDHYEIAMEFGGDPLDFRQRGLMILKRRV